MKIQDCVGVKLAAYVKFQDGRPAPGTEAGKKASGNDAFLHAALIASMGHLYPVVHKLDFGP
ncbi:MAG: hypothetical protein QXS16_03780 [Pyrobaculum sp.]